jgi:hypothetical protein
MSAMSDLDLVLQEADRVFGFDALQEADRAIARYAASLDRLAEANARLAEATAQFDESRAGSLAAQRANWHATPSPGE